MGQERKLEIGGLPVEISEEAGSVAVIVTAEDSAPSKAKKSKAKK